MARRLPSLLLGLLLAAPARAAEPTLDELLNATDDVARGEQSVATIEMYVKTASYERTMKMRAWARGTDRTLVRILEPAKDAGVCTLKVDDNIWNYLPKVDRTMKVPAGMMSGSWMGSHFTNDDLVKESRMSEDFTGKIVKRPADGPEALYVIELVPRPDAPVVWGKVVVRIRPDKLPVDIAYFDEKGRLARTMRFGDVRDFDGRKVPATMTLEPADKPGELTRITYVDLDFDAAIPDSTFTLQALRQ